MNSSNSGGLTKLGNGALILASSSNGYSGATIVNSGTLQFAGSGALGGTSSVTVNGAAMLAVNYGGASDFTQPQLGALLNSTTFNTTTSALGFDTTHAASPATYSLPLSMSGGVTKLGRGC